MDEELIEAINLCERQDLDKAKEFIEIKYKALSEGKLTIKFENCEFESSSVDGLVANINLGDVEIQSTAKAYDFTNFINLVNKIDENNVLNSFNELKEVYQLYNEVKDQPTTDQNVLDAFNKVNKAVTDYNNILKAMEAVNQSSSELESLLGGR